MSAPARCRIRWEAPFWVAEHPSFQTVWSSSWALLIWFCAGESAYRPSASGRRLSAVTLPNGVWIESREWGR